MMLAVLSDIHGNADALQAALGDIQREKVDAVVCCGDIVGYYYQPARCLELLVGLNAVTVKGNHEYMLADVITDPASGDLVRAKYGSGLDVALETLSRDQLESLTTLPDVARFEADGKDVLVAHGSPWDKDLYVYPDAPAETFARCAASDADFVLLGHTHYPLARRVAECVVLNPGSVGQARGGAGGTAQWALLDTVTSRWELRTTAYDPSGVANDARRRDPAIEYLWRILQPAGAT